VFVLFLLRQKYTVTVQINVIFPIVRLLQSYTLVHAKLNHFADIVFTFIPSLTISCHHLFSPFSYFR